MLRRGITTALDELLTSRRASPIRSAARPWPLLGPMRLATWNVNSLKARLERVLAWTERHQPDVLCLQATKLSDEQAPLMEFRALVYDLLHHGPGSWNGVAIASRIGIEDVTAGIPPPDGWTDDGGR